MTASTLRITRWVERAALCLGVLFLCVHGLPRAWRSLNTDFPNYYLAARLVHDGYDTSRMYEWTWIEREKDHRAIDDRVIGLLPITPFSTLAILPLASLKPLDAKHVWILFNLGLLIPIGWLVREMTGLRSRRIAIVMLFSFPLYRNLLYGQFYIFLLLLLTAACFSYLRGHRRTAGALVAIAAACKVFPLLFLVFFLQRRDWRALTSSLLTGVATIAISISVFGLSANRTWLQEILPWVMRGEGLGTYSPTASISGVLHRLLLAEPQWNPHPWHSSSLLYAALSSILPMVLLAPAILLVRRASESRERISLEWSALLTASLTVSTIPASYNFVLMIFPTCVIAGVLLRQRRYSWLVALAIAYLGIGYPLPVPSNPMGLSLLLYIPRLPLMIGVLLGNYALLWRGDRTDEVVSDWSRYAWGAAMAGSVLFNAHAAFIQQRAQREEYAFRVPLQNEGLLNASPQVNGSGVTYTSFTLAGYRLIREPRQPLQADGPYYPNEDELSFFSSSGTMLVERASGRGSKVIDVQHPGEVVVEDGREPMVSEDGKDLAFLRDDRGRGRLMLQRSFRAGAAMVQLTPSQWNVYEASFLSSNDYAVAASEGQAIPAIHLFRAGLEDEIVSIEAARYPALSPDGRWLAYSHLEHGVWNLWIREQESGATRRIADVPCNQVQPSWEGDSKTLLYGSDCGRSVWFTAVSRRRVIP